MCLAILLLDSVVLCIAGAESTSVKDAVKAALGQKADTHKGLSSYALLDPSVEARVQFWARPGLQDPSLQERCQHAWAAVLSPTGELPYMLASLSLASCTLTALRLHGGLQLQHSCVPANLDTCMCDARQWHWSWYTHAHSAVILISTCITIALSDSAVFVCQREDNGMLHDDLIPCHVLQGPVSTIERFCGTVLHVLMCCCRRGSSDVLDHGRYWDSV